MDYEVQLLWKMGVKIYKIPPMSTNQGYYLDSWKEHKIAEVLVNMKVVSKGNTLTVLFLNPDNSLFVAAPMPEDHNQALVRCVDSSRGYAIRLTDPKGKHVWLGMVFGDRNDSFDFHTCLEDFAQKRDMELHPEKYAKENEPTRDFSLKKGEKLVLNLGGAGTTQSSNTNTSNKPSGGFKLPPPGSKLPGPGTSTQQTTQKTSTSNDLLGGGFGDWGSNTTSNTQKSNTSSGFDAFSGFGNFGSNNNTSNNQDFGFGNSSNNNFGFGNSNNNNFGFGNSNNNNNNNFGFGGNTNNNLLGDFGFGGQSNSNNTQQNTGNKGNSNFVDLL